MAVRYRSNSSFCCNNHFAKPAAAGRPVHPQYLARLIDEIASDDAIIASDVGTPTVWAARYLTTNGKRRLLFSANHGSMANALPQAIGAQAAEPARQVVTMSGDGGLAMLLGDLLTLKQLDLPVKVVVFDNQILGFVAMEQKAGGFLPVNTALENPDFAVIAQAFLGIRVDNSMTLEEALRRAFAHEGPALVQVRIATQELAMPPKVELEQVKGFSLYALKAVLNGRGDELVELAKTNLRWNRVRPSPGGGRKGLQRHPSRHEPLHPRRDVKFLAPRNPRSRAVAHVFL